MKLSIPLSLALVAGMAVTGSQLMAQEAAPQPQTQTPTAQQPSSSDMQQDMQSFTGTVAKEGKKYVLKVAGTSYELDNQDQAKQFEGKQVKVMGKLDTATNMLHVQSIEPAS